MNADVYKGQWKQMRGRLKVWWANLTDDEATRVEGNKQILLGLVQERYGHAKDRALAAMDAGVDQLTRL